MEHIKICRDQLKSCFEGKIQDQTLMREGKSLLLPKPMYKRAKYTKSGQEEKEQNSTKFT